MKAMKRFEENFKNCEVYHNKKYGKSQTDSTHFKPNVSEANSLFGASNEPGLYDDNEEMGKLRSVMSNPSLDVAERDDIADEVLKQTDNAIKSEVESIKDTIKDTIKKSKAEPETTDTTE